MPKNVRHRKVELQYQVLNLKKNPHFLINKISSCTLLPNSKVCSQKKKSTYSKINYLLLHIFKPIQHNSCILQRFENESFFSFWTGINWQKLWCIMILFIWVVNNCKHYTLGQVVLNVRALTWTISLFQI